MAPAQRNPDLEELGIGQHRARRRESATRMTGNADPVEIEPRAGQGELFERRDVVLEPTRLVEIAVGEIVKRLVAPRGASTIDDEHRESERGERLGVVDRHLLAEAGMDPPDLRTRITVIDDGIALLRVEAMRAV